jgi:energy-coupling factor transporter ATP-binding protein EcfA2
VTEPTTTTETKPETITSLEITRFRGIREGRLDDIAPLTILVGPNGCGKSTILDAAFIAGAPDPGMAIGAIWKRGVRVAAAARWLVWRAGTDGPAEITLGPTRQTWRKVLIKAANVNGVLFRTEEGNLGGFRSSPASWSGQPLNVVTHYPLVQTGAKPPGVPELRLIDQLAETDRPLHELYSETARLGQSELERVESIIRDLVPELHSLKILTEGDSPVLSLMYPDRGIPAVLAGDGVHALIRMTLELVGRTAGTRLLEEPEVHLHPGAIYQTMQVVVAAVRRGMQIIMTTHSLELIDALLSLSNNEDLGRMALYRLRLDDGTLKSVRLNGEEISFSRMTIEDDLR